MRTYLLTKMNKRPSKYLLDADPIMKANAKMMELIDKNSPNGSLSKQDVGRELSDIIAKVRKAATCMTSLLTLQVGTALLRRQRCRI